MNLDAFKADFEAKAALAARKGDDIKFEVKLPPEVMKTVPEGLDLKINPKDPRLPLVRELAIKNNLPQSVIDDFVNMDAQLTLQRVNAETQRIETEDKKLGDNAQARKDAVTNWLKGLADRRDISNEEYEAFIRGGSRAAFVSGMEKIMAKLAGHVPGAQPPGAPSQEQKPPEKTLAQRWYPNNPSSQARA